MIFLISACALFLLIALIRTRSRLATSESQNLRLQQDSEALITRFEEGHQREIKRLLDALPYAFFSINAQGKIIRLNQNAHEIFGERNILNRSIRQVFFDAPIVEEIEKVLNSPGKRIQQLSFPADSAFSKKSNKKESHWELALHPVSIERDSIEVQVMMRDISANIETDQIRQDFVANASHELRTPLAIISGYLENLTEEDGLSNEAIAKKMLTVMERHVVRINHIVEEMLLISKLESAKAAPLKISTFSLADCLNDIIERLELVIEKQKAQVLNRAPALQMSGDLFYWTQILFNLIENALKQNTQSPVTILITADQKESGMIEIKVSDNGIGIPSSDLPFIFKRFFRVEKHHSRNQVKGTGLGLSIVKRAVEAHGGQISARSTPGLETTFVIKAPQPPICDSPLSP